jgi:sugar phosphate permease
LLAALLAAGILGASVQSASGRAVMAAFPPSQRGLALGIRQTAIPISGFAVSLSLPHVVHAFGVGWGFAGLGIAALLAAAIGIAVVRDVVPPAGEDETVSPHRDPRVWKIAIGSALVVAPQMCIVGFTVLFLHDHRALTPGSAAAVLAGVQLLGVAGRIGAGRWSDVVGSRIGPLRLIALVDTVLVVLCAATTSAPLVVLVPVLVAAGAVSMSWNGLAFAAAIENAGHRRSGVAIGLQQSVLNGFGSVYPGLFGALVALSSWRIAFLAVAAFPLAGWRVLRALDR